MPLDKGLPPVVACRGTSATAQEKSYPSLNFPIGVNKKGYSRHKDGLLVWCNKHLFGEFLNGLCSHEEP
jgi:hypothetical protein